MLTLLRLRRCWVWAALLAATAVALCQTPLFNLLGYEFSLVMALLVSFAAAHLGSATVSVSRTSDAGLLLATHERGFVLALLAGRAVLLGWALLVLPFAAIALNALRVQNCAFLKGVAFFALLPLASAAVAACVGVLAGIVLPRPRLATALALGTLLCSFAWGLYRFYVDPAVFAYDPFVGYFPGALYDEDLAVRAPLLWHRLYDVSWVLAALALACQAFDPATLSLRREALRLHRPAALVGAPALALAVILFLLRAPLGFAVDASHVQSTLGGSRRTPHFELYFPAHLPKLAVDRLAEDHELRYAQLTTVLGPPRTARPIRSYLFESAEQKRRLMGAAQTFIAKPWLREVYLQLEDFPHRVLKHELVHVLAADHGDRLFGVSVAWRRAPGLPLPYPSFNMGLIEGLAVALDWPPADDATGHQRAAALVASGLAPPLEQLFGLGFWTHAGPRSYTLAGSFCRYLLIQHGVAPFLALYRSGGDFERSYGRPIGALGADWRQWLSRLPRSPDELQLAKETFRRPSILRRVCAHEVANLRAQAQREHDRQEVSRALALYSRICAFDPSDPEPLLAQMELLAGAGRLREALALRERTLAHPSLTPPLRRRTWELVGDLRWRADDLAEAGAAYASAAAFPGFSASRRLLALKRWALSRPAEFRRLLRDYLLGRVGEARNPAADVHRAHRLAAAQPDLGLGPYLVGKQLAGHRVCGEAIAPLERALALPLPSHEVALEARRALGICQYLEGRLPDAARTFTTLRASPGTPDGLRLEAADWLARITWRLSPAQPLRPIPSLAEER